MDEHTMKPLLQQQQQQQQQQLSGNVRNADTANLLSQQSLMQQQTNFAAAMTNNDMCTTGAARDGGEIGLGTFTQNDRITPPLALPLPHVQHGHLQQRQQLQQQQRQQLSFQSSQRQQQLSLMTSSSTAANNNNNNNNNLFAGIDPTQMMHLPQSSQNMILQRQYQATADLIAEEHKARAIQIAGQRVNGATGANNANSASTPTSSGGTAHQFLQSLQKDTTPQGLHIASANHAHNDALLVADVDAEAEADVSDPLMASLQMYSQYSQYGEYSNPLAVNSMGGGARNNDFSNGNNGQLQTNSNNTYDGNGFGPPSTRNEGGVDDKLQQLQTIQAQLAQLQRMEIEMKQQAEAHEKQLQQQRQLQLQQEQLQQRKRQQQQQQRSVSASASALTQHAGRLTPPTNNGDGESSGVAAAPALSPPSLPVDAAMSDTAAQGMRAKVRQYEAAARSILIQEGKRRRSKTPQQQQRRRSSVVSSGSSSTGDETGRKRRAPDQSWRDVMKDDTDVQECRAKMRRRVEHYVANCMLSDKSPAVVASNAPFRRALASKLEERLYGAAPTFEQYSDSTTLEARLKILAMQIGKRIEGEPGKRKRRRVTEITAAARYADAKTTESGGGSDSGSTGGNSVASVVEDDTNKLRSLRDHVGEDKYATIVQVVKEIRTIRRTSDVWMSSDSANRQPGTTCNTKPRQAFPASGLEVASAIIDDGNSTSNNGTNAASPISEKKSTSIEETKENSTADEAIETKAAARDAADRKVNIIRPGSPDELSAVESMPRALTNIYFSTRLVAALTALGPSHHGSIAQVEGADWDRLLAEAKTNLKAFRVLEKSTEGSDRQSFVEVCALSGHCRLERVDS